MHCRVFYGGLTAAYGSRKETGEKKLTRDLKYPSKISTLSSSIAPSSANSVTHSRVAASIQTK
ncbi:unnamed protein product [Clonostachys rosea f. rosea IK726]|uniref:Uncharacterized protein n=2 Tax=Bionectria ochroleuca TaxID=29856 RepID=A0A0B7KMN1_BIOOC|nr:unnamed protein product [Clonostachys rosea f. rosea IK726]